MNAEQLYDLMVNGVEEEFATFGAGPNGETVLEAGAGIDGMGVLLQVFGILKIVLTSIKIPAKPIVMIAADLLFTNVIMRINIPYVPEFAENKMLWPALRHYYTSGVSSLYDVIASHTV